MFGGWFVVRRVVCCLYVLVYTGVVLVFIWCFCVLCVCVVFFLCFFFFLLVRLPPSSTQGVSSAASDGYRRKDYNVTAASGIWPVEVTMQASTAGQITVDRLYNVDRSTTSPEQWSQELRLASDLEGDWNFMVGGFYLSYESDDQYYIYSSALELAVQQLGIAEE